MVENLINSALPIDGKVDEQKRISNPASRRVRYYVLDREESLVVEFMKTDRLIWNTRRKQ